MIFISVGTDYHQFDRLINYFDTLLLNQIISQNDVFMQIGPSTVEPKYCKNYSRLIPFNEMENYYDNSDIIITHGGPGTIFNCIIRGKKPIVIPRSPEFDEVIDDHQIIFSKKLNEGNTIHLCNELNDIEKYLTHLNKNDYLIEPSVKKVSFNDELEKISLNLIK